MSVPKLITMAKIEASVLKSKFRGCLLGALIGDCTGAPFEGDTITHGDKLVIQRYYDKLEDPTFTGKLRKSIKYRVCEVSLDFSNNVLILFLTSFI